jgi:hypothetical protein
MQRSAPPSSPLREKECKIKAAPPLCPGKSESDLSSISERLVVLIVVIDLRRALEGQRQIGSGRDSETANGPRSRAATAGRQSSDSHLQAPRHVSAGRPSVTP